MVLAAVALPSDGEIGGEVVVLADRPDVSSLDVA